MNTDDLRQRYGKPIYFNCKDSDEAFTDKYVLWLENQLLNMVNNKPIMKPEEYYLTNFRSKYNPMFKENRQIRQYTFDDMIECAEKYNKVVQQSRWEHTSN